MRSLCLDDDGAGSICAGADAELEAGRMVLCGSLTRHR